jgi:hypothetical protein
MASVLSRTIIAQTVPFLLAQIACVSSNGTNSPGSSSTQVVCGRVGQTTRMHPCGSVGMVLLDTSSTHAVCRSVGWAIRAFPCGRVGSVLSVSSSTHVVRGSSDWTTRGYPCGKVE